MKPWTLEDYREIVNLPTHLVVVIGADSTFLKANEEVNPILMWHPDDIIGEKAKNFIHPEDWEETYVTMSGLYLGTRSLITDFTNRCLRKDGTYRWISWSASMRHGKIYALGVDVTEKMQFEHELTIQGLVLESISEGVIICDEEGTIVYSNSAEENLLGYQSDELLGKPIQIINAHDKLESKERLKKVFEDIENEGIWIGEWNNIKKDGTRFTTSCRVTTLMLNDERHLVIVQRDITTKKKRQKEKDELQNQFRMVSDRLSLAVKTGKIGIWEWKPGSEKVSWDEVVEGIYGYAPGTFSGNVVDYSNGIHPDDREPMWIKVSESQAKKEAYLVEHRIIRPNGEIRWVQCSGNTIYGDNGEPTLMMGTCMDITEKMVASLDQQFLSNISETLSSSFNIQENLSIITESAIEYFCDGCVIDQLRPDGDIRRTVVAHKDPEIKQKIYQIHERYPQRYSSEHPLFTALITGKTVVIEDARTTWQGLKEKFGDGYYVDVAHINSRGTITVRLKGRDNLLGTITFFTGQHSNFKFDQRSKWLAEEIAYRASMAIENSLLYLNSQEAIKSRDEFLSIASHELKTPLTSLTLQNQMRLRQLEKGDHSVLQEHKFRRAMDADDRQLRRINRLIDDMLDIARIRAERLTILKEEFEFCHFISDVIERFTPQMEAAGCPISVSLTTPVNIHGDLYRIEQVVVNMLTNAMKYGAGQPIKIEVTKTNYKVSFLVHDKGPGIDAKDVDRIFQRFERAVIGRDISGLGLGLYISRQIVEQHDGTLFVTSEVGKGSTFVMELPLHA
jgi:PAS domain S-box-containing protein